MIDFDDRESPIDFSALDPASVSDDEQAFVDAVMDRVRARSGMSHSRVLAELNALAVPVLLVAALVLGMLYFTRTKLPSRDGPINVAQAIGVPPDFLDQASAVVPSAGKQR